MEIFIKVLSDEVSMVIELSNSEASTTGASKKTSTLTILPQKLKDIPQALMIFL
ncbi:MAG: hypothetical protein ABDH21_06510 [bacterium]